MGVREIPIWIRDLRLQPLAPGFRFLFFSQRSEAIYRECLSPLLWKEEAKLIGHNRALSPSNTMNYLKSGKRLIVSERDRRAVYPTRISVHSQWDSSASKKDSHNAAVSVTLRKRVETPERIISWRGWRNEQINKRISSGMDIRKDVAFWSCPSAEDAMEPSAWPSCMVSSNYSSEKSQSRGCNRRESRCTS